MHAMNFAEMLGFNESSIYTSDKLCKFCNMPIKFWRINDNLIIPLTCSCSEAQKEEEIRRKEKERQEAQEEARKNLEQIRDRLRAIFKDTGVNEYFAAKKLKKTQNNSALIDYASYYSSNFEELRKTEKNGIFITGEPGAGKSHIATKIIKSLLSKGYTCYITTMIDITETFKACMNDQTNDYYTMQDLVNIEFLVIDDLGKELPTDWAISKLFQLINSRYEKNKPFVITSNYSLQELTQRLAQKSEVYTAESITRRINDRCKIFELTKFKENVMTV